MLLQVTEIEFDLTLDEDEQWQLDDPEMLQTQLQNGYIGKIMNVIDGDDLVEEITSATGWCIKSINYRSVSNTGD
jgi:hypothetical protein